MAHRPFVDRPRVPSPRGTFVHHHPILIGLRGLQVALITYHSEAVKTKPATTAIATTTGMPPMQARAARPTNNGGGGQSSMQVTQHRVASAANHYSHRHHSNGNDRGARCRPRPYRLAV